MEKVILVDENDCMIGTAGKMEAHRNAMLHRAFSVFIFNAQGKMLLQQRADTKYHSGGLWTNACCSHPRPEEATLVAAERRLTEEMGFTTPLTSVFSFVYQAPFDNGLVEYEYDHVFVGEYNGVIRPDSSEVKDFCFKYAEEIADSLREFPEKYTAWFHIAFPKLLDYLESRAKIAV
ncbi:isopentenyl-diphosphate Delta-isomerase [Filimonas effusa]|uniref:Isopentenyl-diphosphate delta-isomerase n=1 Tax=Filimonas effusa TaxID=2508721 RepID=A0A4V1M9N5_9BACT|nr:isopentenyl-diphosphate Delta-isomerase [Filimonas effusa]RXK81830.1 isopentenyl-diphosphate Delta-isomerase [Filimonas effusa]